MLPIIDKAEHLMLTMDTAVIKLTETLENLNTLARSRLYKTGPNPVMYEYLKGKVIYFAKNGEMLRARLYYDDAVNYLLNNAKAKEVPLSLDIYPDNSYAKNLHETYLIELILLQDELFNSDYGFQ